MTNGLTTRIYLMGASGTGKSTLAKYIATRYNLALLPSAVRELAQERNIPLEQLLGQTGERYDEFQREAFQKQLEMEKAHPDNFVSDRCFDNLAYTSVYGREVWQTARSEAFDVYVDGIKHFDKTAEQVAVFFLRPSLPVFQRAVEQGDRKAFLIWEDICRIDGILEFLLQYHELSYFPIDSPSFRLRCQTVDAAMKLLRL